MNVDNKKSIKISTAELSATLGWNYEDTKAVRKRKSPKRRYSILMEAEKKIINAKEELMKAIQEEANEIANQNTN